LALNATGLLMTTANCLLTEFQPRFTLPAWELLIIAVFITLGALVRKPELAAGRLGNTDFVLQY
jgi:hypothetical protein